jgi:hypothetical protein
MDAVGADAIATPRESGLDEGRELKVGKSVENEVPNNGIGRSNSGTVGIEALDVDGRV